MHYASRKSLAQHRQAACMNDWFHPPRLLAILCFQDPPLTCNASDMKTTGQPVPSSHHRFPAPTSGSDSEPTCRLPLSLPQHGPIRARRPACRMGPAKSWHSGPAGPQASPAPRKPHRLTPCDQGLPHYPRLGIGLAATGTEFGDCPANACGRIWHESNHRKDAKNNGRFSRQQSR